MHWTNPEREHCYVESAQLAQELHANGQYLGCNPLHPTATATSVRVREGKRHCHRRPVRRNPRTTWRILPD